MAKVSVRAPISRQFHRCSTQVPAKFFELALEALKEREGISRGARESREDAIVIEPTDFARAMLEDRVLERDLSIAGHDDAIMAANAENGCAFHPRVVRHSISTIRAAPGIVKKVRVGHPKRSRSIDVMARLGLGLRTSCDMAMESVHSVAARVRAALGDAWIPTIYREQVLADRTRRYALNCPTGARRVEIVHTLLGIEVKLDGRRVLVPDLAVARYVAVFARSGAEASAIPYDITRISRVADCLEHSWQRLLVLVEHHAGGRSSSFRARVRARLRQWMREELKGLGAGAPYPSFELTTRRR